MVVGRHEFDGGGLLPVVHRQAQDGRNQLFQQQAGGGGIVGAAELARATADGYTLGFVPAAMGTITPLVYRNTQFNPDTELTPVATVGISPLLVVASSASVPA